MITTKDADAAGHRATAAVTAVTAVSSTVLPVQRTCEHQPPCPTAEAADREAAHLVASHPEQGWALLCNGVVMFDDTGELLPDGRIVAPNRRQTG